MKQPPTDMPIVIIENETDLETIIIRMNDHCILVNEKTLVLSVEQDEWLCDEKLTKEEDRALLSYLSRI